MNWLYRWNASKIPQQLPEYRDKFILICLQNLVHGLHVAGVP